jgi:cell wall assembly regulator SMI1
MFRGLWGALAAAIVAAAVVAFVRSRRGSAGRRPIQRDEAVTEVPVPAQAESGPVVRWPPAPVLGTPTTEDLERYAARSSVFDRLAFTRLFKEGQPWEPLNAATRRRLIRWGMVGLVLVLLAGGTQALESAVFSKETGVEVAGEISVDFQTAVENGTCDEIALDRRAECLFAAIGQDDPQPAPQEPVAASDADCRPKSTRPRVRKLSAKVTGAVNRQWRRIEVWLKANAPRSYRTLGEPGKAGAIAAAEAKMGMPFPNDLRASLLRHNGAAVVDDTWGFGFLGSVNLSVAEIQDAWRGLCEIDAEDEGISDPRAEWWDGRMLPFAADGSGDYLVIDSVRRDVGETDIEGNMGFTPGGMPIRSYYALLKTTADAFESGGSIGYWQPKVVDGELDWDVV